jgi:hypothetical protein
VHTLTPPQLRADTRFVTFMSSCVSSERAGLSGEKYLATLLIAPIQVRTLCDVCPRARVCVMTLCAHIDACTQRIPRYALLLSDCLKRTPVLHRA